MYRWRHLAKTSFAISSNTNPTHTQNYQFQQLPTHLKSTLAQIFNNGAAIESLGDKAVAAEDQAILDAYAAEVLSRAVSASAMRLGATDDSGPNADG